MPDTDSVTIVKRFAYRTTDEEWSNTYHLDGTTPTTEAGWKALFDAIIASEKTCYVPTHKVCRAYGYEAGNDNSVGSHDYRAANTEVLGTYTVGTDKAWAGDQAGWVRAKLPSQSSTGKSVYVRKYFHGGSSTSGDADILSPTLRTAYAAHGAIMLGGTLPGAMKWVAPQGAVPGAVATSQYVTTRTLKRRGRRP